MGCTAVSYCPKQLLLDGRDQVDEPADADEADQAHEPGQGAGTATGDAPVPAPTAAYRSPFRTWDQRATVRAAPRRELPAADDDAAPRLFFSPELVPLARHETVNALRARLFEQILTQHLYRYLDFTMKLEQVVVNRTALGIAQGTVGLQLPDAMRLDAYRIYCDEAYHALFCADLMHQTARRTGITPRIGHTPYFLSRLARIQQDAGPELSALAELVFVIVSETLISGNLSEVPDDPRVVPTVVEVMRDHAVDEGRHHAYFAHFLKELWAQSSAAHRRALALFVPKMIDAFLRPDTAATKDELMGYGMSRDDAEHVVAEVYPEDLIRKTRRGAASQTVRYLARLGALDDPEVQEAFAQEELVQP